MYKDPINMAHVLPNPTQPTLTLPTKFITKFVRKNSSYNIGKITWECSKLIANKNSNKKIIVKQTI